MKLNRLMIAATKSKSGKTTITCALLQALKDMGQNVVAYKCGPDYIDPMFHQKVIDVPSKNLDTFFTSQEETKRLFLKNRKEGDFAVLEGVMGLFDGLGGIKEEGSSYHLAKVTKTPIILVVDVKGMGRSMIPLIAGFLAYDKEHLIKGIILNRLSKAYYEIIKPVLEKELAIDMIGYLPEDKAFHIESRHLGLIMPNEITDIKKQLQKLSKELQKTISIERIIDIAEQAEALEHQDQIVSYKNVLCSHNEQTIIAVAKDEAFCFYYEDNLQLLRENGAKIDYFSPLYDTQLPNKCCGILLGGGYPELYAKALSQNKKMLLAIKRAIENEKPLVAECGGFMYLHSIIKDKEEKQYAMADVLSTKCFHSNRLVRFGYIEIEEKQSNFLPKGERIRGHEFHYFDSEYNGTDCIAIKPATGKQYDCIITGKNYWMGFPHLYYPSNPKFAKCFMEKARDYARISTTG